MTETKPLTAREQKNLERLVEAHFEDLRLALLQRQVDLDESLRSLSAETYRTLSEDETTTSLIEALWAGLEDLDTREDDLTQAAIDRLTELGFGAEKKPVSRFRFPRRAEKSLGSRRALLDRVEVFSPEAKTMRAEQRRLDDLVPVLVEKERATKIQILRSTLSLAQVDTVINSLPKIDDLLAEPAKTKEA